MSGIGPLPVVEPGDLGDGERRNGGTGQTDVSEQSERWRLIDWFVGGRIISRTRTGRERASERARLIALMASHPYVYAYHGQCERAEAEGGN